MFRENLPSSLLAATAGALVLGMALGLTLARLMSRSRNAATHADTDPALAAALAARRRRLLARKLVAHDPVLAHELRVGRPDLPHSYDDGGLVDLTTAPAEVIAAVCHIEVDVASRVAAPFADDLLVGSIEEVLAVTGVPMRQWARVLDRAVVVGQANA